VLTACPCGAQASSARWQRPREVPCITAVGHGVYWGSRLVCGVPVGGWPCSGAASAEKLLLHTPQGTSDSYCRVEMSKSGEVKWRACRHTGTHCPTAQSQPAWHSCMPHAHSPWLSPCGFLLSPSYSLSLVLCGWGWVQVRVPAVAGGPPFPGAAALGHGSAGLPGSAPAAGLGQLPRQRRHASQGHPYPRWSARGPG